MTAKELKASILDLAVRGKLVPQDPNDEPASVLLEKIRAEKRRLVKAGKIKKEKNPSEIYIAADGKPYEKFADGSETCIEDEIPFELPKGWAWARLGNVIELVSGRDLTPDQYSDQLKGTIYITGPSCLSDEGVLLKRWTSEPSVYAYAGDVLLVCKGAGYGKTVICDVKEAHIARQIMAIKQTPHLDMRYVKHYLDANAARIKEQGQGVIPGIDRNSVLSLLFAVPPLKEQQRIVANVKELTHKLNEYSKAENKLAIFSSTFAPALKKSILQYAVEGKLVPQDPNDEPASVLVERIAEERKALVKAGKLKRDKNESVIFRGADRLAYETRNGETVCIEDELPFKIPETWAWVRFNSLGTFVGGHTPSLADHANWEYGSVLWITSKDMKSKYIVESGEKLSPKGARELQLLPPETILMVTRSGILKHTFPVAIAKKPLTINQDQRALRLYFPEMSEFVYVLLRGLESRVLRDFVKKGTTVQSILWDKFINMSIPLPPIAEQERIVSEVKRLEAQVAQLQ